MSLAIDDAAKATRKRPEPLFPGQEIEPLPAAFTSLVERMVKSWQRGWSSGSADTSFQAEDLSLCSAVYDTNRYLRRRMPDEIESILATFDHKALVLVHKRFGERAMSLQNFTEAIINCGTYDPNRVPAFIGGVVDFFLEVQRSQRERADGAPPSTVRWGQVMNHFIESPEVAMFEGQEIMGAQQKGSSDGGTQTHMHRSLLIDCAKHSGMIEKTYWLPYLGDLLTVERTESIYFWPSNKNIDAVRSELTPQLPNEYFGENGEALFTVLALAWDQELQDITALLSNRMFIMWRLRSREKGQFQQKRVLRVDAHKVFLGPAVLGQAHREFKWDLDMKVLDTKVDSGAVRANPTPTDARASSKAKAMEDQRKMMRDKHTESQAAEIATMLDIWWTTHLRMYVTTDRHGKLYFWDIRKIEANLPEAGTPASYELTAHTRAVTGLCEISRTKFTTISLDRTVILWDTRNLTAPELKIEEHCNSILAQFYLPIYSSLVTVGCEKRIYVWSIDSTAYRGVRGKLSAHSANVRDVSGGQRVFFTLDENCTAIMWDGATLAVLQTLNCKSMQPRSALVMPSMARLCLIGRRLNFFEASETLAPLLGMALSKEQAARRQAELDAAGTLKERARPRYCGLSSLRGCVLSVTEVEVRVHSRVNPLQARVIFNVPDGEQITSFCSLEDKSFSVLGTSKGAIHFLKYRSGFALKVYPGRKAEDRSALGPRRETGGVGNVPPASGSGSGVAPHNSQGESAMGAGADAHMNNENGDAAKGAFPSAQSPSSNLGDGRTRPRIETAGSPSKHSEFTLEKLDIDFPGAASPRNSGEKGKPPASEVARQLGKLVDGRNGGENRKETQRSEVYAPSAEDLQRGLSSCITCLLPCEAVERLFVGTAEGQVFIFRLDIAKGFPVIRCTTPDDHGEVTCLHVVMPDPRVVGDPGLLVVGTKEGSVLLYGMMNLKPAGSVNIPRILPDPDQPHGSSINCVRIFHVQAAPDLPLTLLTVDARSRTRLWGLCIHSFSGKVSDLRLVLDGGLMMPLRLDLVSGAAVAVAEPGEVEATALRRKLEAEREEKARAAARAEKIEAAKKKGKLAMLMEAETKDNSKTTVVVLPPEHTSDSPITCFCVMECTFALPTFERLLFTEKARLERERLKKQLEELEKQEAERVEPVPTPSPGSSRALKRKATQEVKIEEVEDDSDNDDLSSVDLDDEQLVRERLELRPRTPPLLQKSGEEAPSFPVANGSNYIFVADGNGWMRCLDVVGTVTEATRLSIPLKVYIDDPVVAFVRGEAYGTTNTSVSAGVGNRTLLPPGKPRPETWRVVGAWRCSEEAILSVVPAFSPPSLVVADAAKEVKVWSTFGELWARFTLRSPDPGQMHLKTVWPPPQTLASQQALMMVAKSVIAKLGLSASKAKMVEKQKQLQLENAMATTASQKDFDKYDLRKRFGSQDSKQPSKELNPIPANSRLMQVSSRQPLDASPSSRGADETINSLSKKTFTHDQMTKLIRGNAFSSGFKSFKQFQSASQQRLVRQAPRALPTAAQLKMREEFFMERRPSTFGIDLATDKDQEIWMYGTQGLGTRSASESTLVRFGHHAVSDMTRSVRREIGIDVCTTGRRQIRRPSFVARLDVAGVSSDPTDPLSATGQAVFSICDPTDSLNATGKEAFFSILDSPSSRNLKAIGDTGGDGIKDNRRCSDTMQRAGKMAVRSA